MAPALVLMFHGIDGPRSRAVGYAADAHYTVDAACFAAMLDALRASGCTLGAARDLLDDTTASRPVWLTFDDGDASNALEALPVLAERGVAADFFITPARVGRPGFMDWNALRDMAAAGMSLQSHGHTHAYFTHLDAAALREELRVSKDQLEQGLGQPVTLLAPPGGRVPRGLVPLAQSLGYRAVLDSTPGLVERRDPSRTMPRVAVTAGHSVETVVGWATRGPSALRRLRLRHGVLATAKAVLGDARYERFRRRALGASA
jgi:peptidoglycan/xylan/chitin deacetylase (PgdA/CDA1 family)